MHHNFSQYPQLTFYKVLIIVLKKKNNNTVKTPEIETQALQHCHCSKVTNKIKANTPSNCPNTQIQDHQSITIISVHSINLQPSKVKPMPHNPAFISCHGKIFGSIKIQLSAKVKEHWCKATF